MTVENKSILTVQSKNAAIVDAAQLLLSLGSSQQQHKQQQRRKLTLLNNQSSLHSKSCLKRFYYKMTNSISLQPPQLKDLNEISHENISNIPRNVSMSTELLKNTSTKNLSSSPTCTQNIISSQEHTSLTNSSVPSPNKSRQMSLSPDPSRRSTSPSDESLKEPTVSIDYPCAMIEMDTKPSLKKMDIYNLSFIIGKKPQMKMKEIPSLPYLDLNNIPKSLRPKNPSVILISSKNHKSHNILNNTRIDEQIDIKHAKIVWNWKVSRWNLFVLGSSGVWVNGRWISQDTPPVILKNKSEMQIGAREFRFICKADVFLQDLHQKNSKDILADHYGKQMSSFSNGFQENTYQISPLSSSSLSISTNKHDGVSSIKYNQILHLIVSFIIFHPQKSATFYEIAYFLSCHLPYLWTISNIGIPTSDKQQNAMHHHWSGIVLMTQRCLHQNLGKLFLNLSKSIINETQTYMTDHWTVTKQCWKKFWISNLNGNLGDQAKLYNKGIDDISENLQLSRKDSNLNSSEKLFEDSTSTFIEKNSRQFSSNKKNIELNNNTTFENSSEADVEKYVPTLEHSSTINLNNNNIFRPISLSPEQPSYKSLYSHHTSSNSTPILDSSNNLTKQPKSTNLTWLPQTNCCLSSDPDYMMQMPFQSVPPLSYQQFYHRVHHQQPPYLQQNREIHQYNSSSSQQPIPSLEQRIPEQQLLSTDPNPNSSYPPSKKPSNYVINHHSQLNISHAAAQQMSADPNDCPKFVNSHPIDSFKSNKKDKKSTPSLNSTVKNVTVRKYHTPNACVHCKAAHLACDASRPCGRCRRLGKEGCIDVDHKKRGRPSISNKIQSKKHILNLKTDTHITSKQLYPNSQETIIEQESAVQYNGSIEEEANFARKKAKVINSS